MDSKKIGEKLKELRGTRTQADVAKAVDVTQSAYCQYETGDRIPTDEVKIRLAEFYNQTVQNLFYA